MRGRFLIYLWWVVFLILNSRALGGAIITCNAWKSDLVLTHDSITKCHVKTRLPLQNENKPVPNSTKIQLAALFASGPEIGVSILEALTKTKLLRQLPNNPDAITAANKLRQALAEKDLANFPDALAFVRNNPRGAEAWELLANITPDPLIRRNVTHLESVVGYLTKYPERTSIDFTTTANQFENIEDYLNVIPDINQNTLVKGTRFDHFSNPSITNYNENFSHAEYSFYLWKNNKWDELEDFFTSNNLNGGWPPNEGFKNVVNTETGAQLAGKKFDRFQGPGDISGRFASPVYSGEDIGDLFFTYDSRALKYNIAEGTQYILFEVKSSVPSGLKFDYGEVTPWFGTQGLGDQVKSSIRFEDIKDHLEIIDTKTYINGQWQ